MFKVSLERGRIFLDAINADNSVEFKEYQRSDTDARWIRVYFKEGNVVAMMIWTATNTDPVTYYVGA